MIRMHTPPYIQDRPGKIVAVIDALLGRMTSTSREPRWSRWITRIAIIAPLPYSLSRLLWAAGIPIGIDSHALQHDLQSPGWGSLGMLILILMTEGTGVYTHVFVGSRPRTVPGWIPLLRGRAIRPWLVIAPLILPIWILAGFNYWSLPYIADGFAMPDEVSKTLPAWSFWMQVAIFWVWGVSLAISTGIYWFQTRRWWAESAGKS